MLLVVETMAIVLLLAGGVLCNECASKYASCQIDLYSAAVRLQRRDYAGYCLSSSAYVACVGMNMGECDSILYNGTALIEIAITNHAVYCPSDTNPGHQVCHERLAACRVIYPKSQGARDNDTVNCSVFDEYISCVVRDLSPCHQQSFSVTTFTSNLPPNQSCVDAEDRCSFRYTRCRDVSVSTSAVKNRGVWEQFCSQSEVYLSCMALLVDRCDSVYSRLLNTSLSTTAVKADRNIYCSNNGPSYYTCRTRHDECLDLLVITGDIFNTVVLVYCRSLNDYMKCINLSMTPCQQPEFKITRLRSVARANFTAICTGVDINGARTAVTVRWTFFLICYFALVGINC